MQMPGTMRAQQRFLSLLVTAVVVLLLAIVAADEPLTSPGLTFPVDSGATPEPMINPESVVSGKSEASGESEIVANPLEQLTTGGPPVSFAGAVRSHTDDAPLELLHGDPANLDSFSVDPLPGDTQNGPAMDVGAQSQESQESMDHDVDSEESLASQGM